MFPEVAGGHWEALEEVDTDVDPRPGGFSIRDPKHQQVTVTRLHHSEET